MGLIVQWDSIQREFVVVNFNDKIPRYHLNFQSLFNFFTKKVWVAPKWTHSFILPRSIKSFPEAPGDIAVKSKLSIRSGYTALIQLNPIIKKGPSSFFGLRTLN